MERERKLLQQAIAIAATIPVAAGLYGVLFGQALTGDAVSISAESHFRYLSGLLLGIGLCFWSTLPSIENQTGRFRLLTLLVVIGGLGRLIGLALTGLPSLFMMGGLIVELIIAPALCLWQTRVANRYAEEYGVAEA
jgi:Cu/Ag efflux pump CusA